METPSINIAKFTDHLGRILQVPSKEKTRLAVLQYMCSKFKGGVQYTEKEVNEILRAWCVVEYMDMRRWLVDVGYLARTKSGSAYWRGLNTPQSWRLPDA